MRRITLDIETTAALGIDILAAEIAVVGIHDSADDSFRAFTVPEFGALWPVMERADLLIGYNSDHFDIPLLNKYYPGDLAAIRSIDLLAEIRKSLGRRIKLDLVAQGTLKRKKSGHGLDAVRWWSEGKVAQVKKYCLKDVELTKDLYLHALQHGTLAYNDFGKIREVPIDTSSWETPAAHALTHTLPF